jgi:hypothetical protein
MMAFDAAHNQIVLFGGCCDARDNFLNETWTWDGTNWTKQSPTNSPSARYDAAMAYDAAHSQVVLFGGVNNGGLNDTWTWDGTNWTKQSPTNSPSARYNPAMAYDAASGQVVLFGGCCDAGINLLNDTWTWDGTN